jgi:hypothetical protein
MRRGGLGRSLRNKVLDSRGKDAQMLMATFLIQWEGFRQHITAMDRPSKLSTLDDRSPVFVLQVVEVANSSPLLNHLIRSDLRR